MKFLIKEKCVFIGVRSRIIGLNVSLFKMFFIQPEFKGGFINLPNVRTAHSKNDKPSHDFFFKQLNIVFGGTIDIKRKLKEK